MIAASIKVPADGMPDVEAVDRVITQRFANRFFCDRPLSRAVIRSILDVARYTPSGGNIQPWRLYVLGGKVKAELSALMLEAHERSPGAHQSEYLYYPAELPEPYAGRKHQFGTSFYGWLGIEQTDEAARLSQTGRNFLFFDAPVGLIFTIDRRLEAGSWLDLGMFLQSVMLAAKARGIDTCPQESLARYHAILREHLPLSENEIVVCGISMGFPDEARSATLNRVAKATVDEIASFHGL